MELGKCYLLFGDTWFSRKSRVPHDCFSEFAARLKEQLLTDKDYGVALAAPGGNVLTYSNTLKLQDWQSIVSRATNLTEYYSPRRIDMDFWNDRIASVYMYQPEQMEDYIKWNMIVELVPAATESVIELYRRNSLAFSYQRQLIVDALLPDRAAFTIGASDCPHVTSVLMFDVNSQGSDNLAEFLSDSEREVRNLRQAVGIVSDKWEPDILPYALMWRGISLNSIEQDAVLVNLTPTSESTDRHLTLPRLAVDLLEHMRRLQILHHMETRIKASPLYRDSAIEYVQYVERNSTTLNAFRRRFLNDRAIVGADIPSVGLTIKRLNSSLSYSLLGFLFRSGEVSIAKTFFNDRVRVDGHFLMMNEYKSRFDEYVVKVEAATAHLKDKEQWISDYMRDSMSAQVASASHKLQTAVYVLSILTFLVTAFQVIRAIWGS